PPRAHSQERHGIADLESHHGRRHDGAAAAGGRHHFHAALVREGARGEREVKWRAAMSLALAGVAARGPAPARPLPSTLYAAHRGGALLWPENSVLAFKNAIALGADFIELDVHLSKDGEVVVIHDPTVDRTTTGRGRVRTYTLAELGTMRLKDRAGSAGDE